MDNLEHYLGTKEENGQITHSFGDKDWYEVHLYVGTGENEDRAFMMEIKGRIAHTNHAGSGWLHDIGQIHADVKTFMDAKYGKQEGSGNWRYTPPARLEDISVIEYRGEKSRHFTGGRCYAKQIIDGEYMIVIDDTGRKHWMTIDFIQESFKIVC